MNILYSFSVLNELETAEVCSLKKFCIYLPFSMAGVIWMADAMELTILSIVSPEVRCMWDLSSYQEAFITTIVFVGMGLSSSWWGGVCDKFGRKTGLLLCAAWTTYFGFISALSPNYTWLLILRFFTGFGIGGAPQAVTLYSEFLPMKTRSRCIMAIETFWAIGTVFEVFLALIIMPTLGFRWLLAVSAFPLVIVLLAFNYLPESARFNQARGRTDLAQQTLEYLARANGKRLPSVGLKPITKTLTQQAQNQSTSTTTTAVGSSTAHPSQESTHVQENNNGLNALFQDPMLKRTTIYLWMIWFQCSFAYYGLVLLSTSLFKDADNTYGANNNYPNDIIGLNNENTCPADFKEECSLSCKTLDEKDYSDLLWVTLSEFPGLLITLLLLELFGRKTTMAVTYFGFGISALCVIAADSRQALTFFLFSARALISGGFQAAYVYTPEVYPTKIRALALGSCSGMARLGALITPFVAQVLVENNKFLAIVVYAVLALFAAVCALMLPIETKGRKMTDENSETRNSTQMQLS